jgi:hypothetical protein
MIGSFGNGSADELSDIDIVVVIDDRQADAVLEHAVEEIARFGETVWLQEVPGNAPSGGAYASVGFKARPLPIAVDWYWHRLRLVLYPSDAHLLFDKVGIRAPAAMSRLKPGLELREISPSRFITAITPHRTDRKRIDPSLPEGRRASR